VTHRQYVESVATLLVVLTCADRQNGQVVGGGASGFGGSEVI
jgi:hypothetical protein